MLTIFSQSHLNSAPPLAPSLVLTDIATDIESRTVYCILKTVKDRADIRGVHSPGGGTGYHLITRELPPIFKTLKILKPICLAIVL